MTITSNYGAWHARVSNAGITLEQGVGDALDGEYDDDTLDAIIDAYRAAINDALPPEVALCGNEFYGPACEADCDFAGYPHDEDATLDIDAIVASIDFWTIVEKETAK